MWEFWKIAVIFIVTITFVGCGGSNSGSTTILIGISPDYPPFESLNSNNEMEGFDIDMVKELFRIMNENGGDYDPQFRQMGFETIVTAVNTGQVDLGISGFTYDEKRDVAWSLPYNDSKQVALVNANSDIQTINDLKGKSIGVQLGATAEMAVEEMEDVTVRAVTDVKILIETLKAGGIDAVVLDQAVARNYQENGSFRMIDEAILDEQNYIIAKKTGSEELMKDINAAIEQFIVSEKYNELKEKWGV
jgi:ABC-type amino acid transport/signal transduction systems, periplasmic component/domain